MAGNGSTITGFLKELRRRKVIRVAIVYAIVAWLLIQIAETTFEPLDLPGWTLTFVVMLAILGFPVSLVLAWAFDLTPDGIKRDVVDEGEGAAVDADECGCKPASIRSVAVLPFSDMSPDKDQDYFCEGVAEEILNSLAKIDELQVASRTSAFQYKGQSGDIRRIGEALQVGAVLEGSVRKAGNMLRVTAQLIDANSGYHIWSERFDREIEDVFAIQDEIASSVADALQITLSPTEQACIELQSQATRDVEAYDFYLRGWSYFHRFGRKNLEFAQQMFTRATEKDPEFARAWAGLADTYAYLYMYGQAKDEYRDAAREASMKALDLCPVIAESHVSRGLAHMLCQEWSAAEGHFEKAMTLDGQLFEAPLFYARACFHQGKHKKAAELFERAAALQPADYSALLLAANSYRQLDQLEQERDVLERGLEIAERQVETNPDDSRALYLGAGALARLGKREEAIRWIDRAVEAQPGDAAICYNAACVHAILGNTELALDFLEQANLPAMANRAWVENDSDFDSIRDHPRFRDILESLRE